MKILENISIGYKRIATGIAIVSFLAIMYFALIPGASYAHVYGPDGGVLSGAFVFIKEWPQYNDTTDINGVYSVDNVPYGEYTLVAAGNDSYAPNISTINVSASTNPRDVTLKSANRYYLPFLYQNDVAYQAAFQVQNGTSNASFEITNYYMNGTKAGNDFYIVQTGELYNKKVFNITGTLPIFVGPAVIKSDIPVMYGGYIYSIGKKVYSLAPSITDAESTTITNIPFLYNGGAYDSGLQVFNPGTTAASVTVRFYYLNGTQAASTTYTLPPKNLVGTTVSSLLPGVFFVGSSIVTSDLPIVAQGYVRTSVSGIYSIAPALSTPVTDPFIPFLYNGGVYDSGLQVFNPGTSSASVTVRFYYLNGTQAASTTYTLPPKNLVGTTVSSLLPGVFFVGSSSVTSDLPIVAQGYVRTGAGLNVYSIAPQVRKPASAISTHVPYLNNIPGGSHDSGVQVVNPNAVTANINVYYYHSNGTMAGSYSGSVAPNGLVGITVSSIVSGPFTGYSIMSADQPIVTQGYIRQSTDGIYSIAPPVER
jgi:hypothetical protein